jgi:hypothetical protein
VSNKKTAIGVSVSMVVLVAGIVTYAVIQANPKQKSYAPLPQPVSTEAISQDASGSALGVNTGGVLGGNVGLQSNLGSSGGAGSGGSGSSSAPGPDSFAAYDQYKDKDTAMFADLVAGTGNEVGMGTKVAVTYKGWLTDGTMFDQSQTGEDGKLQAFTFTVGEHKVIAGWEQAIIGMKVGGTRRFIVPPAVGYGAEGQDPVPPNALLVFDVVLHAAL